MYRYPVDLYWCISITNTSFICKFFLLLFLLMPLHMDAVLTIFVYFILKQNSWEKNSFQPLSNLSCYTSNEAWILICKYFSFFPCNAIIHSSIKQNFRFNFTQKWWRTAWDWQKRVSRVFYKLSTIKNLSYNISWIASRLNAAHLNRKDDHFLKALH